MNILWYFQARLRGICYRRAMAHPEAKFGGEQQHIFPVSQYRRKPYFGDRCFIAEKPENIFISGSNANVGKAWPRWLLHSYFYTHNIILLSFSGQVFIDLKIKVLT